MLQDSSTRDPISDAINIDTIERTETELNSTLQEHNITKTFEDNHLYYKSTWSTDKTMSEEFWKKISTNLTVNMLLSNSHRRATVCIYSVHFFGSIAKDSRSKYLQIVCLLSVMLTAF